MEELYIVESGVKRRAVKKKCSLCKNTYLERASRQRPSKYCGIECRQIASRTRTEVACAECGSKFYVTLSQLARAKSGYNFCTRKCKDKSQRIGSKSEKMRPKHYGTAGRSPEIYRRLYKEYHDLDKVFCTRCGYDEFECGVDIHHRDGDKKNNHKDNLVALCAPCHRALHNGLWALDETTAARP